VFLVSHDRTFLDNVVTSTIAYEGSDAAPGLWREYEGGVQDWLVQSQRARSLRAASGASNGSSSGAAPVAAPAKAVKSENIEEKQKMSASNGQSTLSKKKLSFKDQRELDALPAKIAALEAEQSTIRAQLADGSLYASDPKQAVALQTRDVQIDEELLGALEKWEALGG
jgi:ATP-binding cassette subfamily F protein uup